MEQKAIRLDEYISKKYDISKTKAQQHIKQGDVYVNGNVITQKAYAFMYDEQNKTCYDKMGKVLDIVFDTNLYVSFGEYKLEKAVEEFKLKDSIKDATCIDIGASTGGFTNVLLKNGAKKVYAIDVGTNQLVDQIANNPKVVSIENMDFRDVDEKHINENIDMIVADVSFISIKKLIDKMVSFNPKDIVILIKPQFEVGKEIARKHNGIIQDKKIVDRVVTDILNDFLEKGYYIKETALSPEKDPKSNKEVLAHLVPYEK